MNQRLRYGSFLGPFFVNHPSHKKSVVRSAASCKHIAKCVIITMVTEYFSHSMKTQDILTSVSFMTKLKMALWVARLIL